MEEQLDALGIRFGSVVVNDATRCHRFSIVANTLADHGIGEQPILIDHLTL